MTELPPKPRFSVVDPEVAHQTAKMRDKGELVPVIGKRCRICRDDSIRKTVNDLLAHGHGHKAIVEHLKPINATRPANRQITADCVYNHDHGHFDAQEPARAIWRRRLEARQAEQGVFDEGVSHLVDSAAYFETVMRKAYETLVEPDTKVDIGLGIGAAKALHEIMRADSGIERMAAMQAQMNRIVAVMRELPATQQEWVMARLDGHEGPALLEAGPVTGDDEDEFVGRDEDDDED